MKTVCFLVCLLAFAFSGRTAAAQDFSGKWQIEFHTSSNTGARPLCTLQQTATAISGTCKGPHSEGPVSGTVNGNSIKLTWSTGGANRGQADGSMQAGGGAWTFTGKLGADGTISGDGTAPTGEPGQFTAKRQ